MSAKQCEVNAYLSTLKSHSNCCSAASCMLWQLTPQFKTDGMQQRAKECRLHLCGKMGEGGGVGVGSY